MGCGLSRFWKARPRNAAVSDEEVTPLLPAKEKATRSTRSTRSISSGGTSTRSPSSPRPWLQGEVRLFRLCFAWGSHWLRHIVARTSQATDRERFSCAALLHWADVHEHPLDDHCMWSALDAAVADLYAGASSVCLQDVQYARC